MTASLSASAIKFYLAESTNKSGFGRLSMGSNWSVLQERSYYVKALCRTLRIRPDAGTRRIFELKMSPPHPLALTGRKKNGEGKKKKKNNIWRTAVAWVNDTRRWICSCGRLCCESFFEISHAGWRYTITVRAFGSSRAHFTHSPRQQRECRP